MVAALGNTWSSMGTPDERRAYANMWQEAYAATDWEGCMSCEDVADCIENDPDTIQAVTNINQTNINGQTPISTSGQGANLLTGVPGCAYDNLYGAMRGLVQWLNENNLDFLDELAGAGTPAERSKVLSEQIPGFAGTALGDAFSASITFLSSTLHNEYDTQYDQPYEDALICELFCFAQDGCELTLRQLYLILAARVGYTAPGDLFYQGLIFTVFGSWTGVQYCDVMMFLQVGAFIFMGGFGGYRGINPLANALSFGFDDPSDDWMLLCDCPDTWTYTIDSATLPAWVEIGTGVNTVGTISGTLIEQTTGVAFGQDITGIQMLITFPTVQTITGMSVNAVAGTNIDPADLVNHFFNYRDAGDVPIGGAGATLPMENGAWEVSYSEAIPGVKYINLQYVFLGTDQTMQFDPIIISGRGTNPFI